MDERPDNSRNVMPTFIGLVLIAVVAWILGSPALGLALGIGAVIALVATFAGHREGVGRSGARPQH